MPRKMCPLAVVRGELNLTRSQLAELAGCSYASVGNAETGIGGTIPAAVRCALAPLLPPIGSSIEKLDGEFRLWRIARREDLLRETEGGAK